MKTLEEKLKEKRYKFLLDIHRKTLKDYMRHSPEPPAWLTRKISELEYLLTPEPEILEACPKVYLQAPQYNRV